MISHSTQHKVDSKTIFEYTQTQMTRFQISDKPCAVLAYITSPAVLCV